MIYVRGGIGMQQHIDPERLQRLQEHIMVQAHSMSVQNVTVTEYGTIQYDDPEVYGETIFFDIYYIKGENNIHLATVKGMDENELFLYLLNKLESIDYDMERARKEATYLF